MRDLHSSMDRLETKNKDNINSFDDLFTFQYGQIRNWQYIKYYRQFNFIYIPVWIDQKHKRARKFI